jgi:phosphate:Na+ symporter
MLSEISIASLFFGLIIFLYGMFNFEKGIRQLSSSSFKQVLRRYTDNPLNSVASGTVVTAVVQSSTMVSLIMLSMVGAGILPLMNAIGVILGANIGTTFTGWIVTTVGFKIQLSEFAIPMLAFGAFLQLINKEQSKWAQWGLIAIGLGLLLFGLDMMKSSVEELPEHIDLTALKGFSPITFFFLGVVITSLIQSSSATMLITLTALNAGIIDLQGAAAFMIGADMGTVSTIMIGSIKGSIVKKQLVLANIIFNLLVDIIALFILLPYLPELLGLFGIEDPLYGLVAFFTGFNVVGVLIFIPILRRFSAWVERILPPKEKDNANVFLDNTPLEIPETATTALSKESYRLYAKALLFCQRSWPEAPDLALLSIQEDGLKMGKEKEDYLEAYLLLKDLEGEITGFSTRLLATQLNDKQSEYISQQIVFVRDVVYAAKLQKDISDNIEHIQHMEQPLCNTLLLGVAKKSNELLTELAKQFEQRPCHQHRIDDMIEQLEKQNSHTYRKLLDKSRQLSTNSTLSDEELSTVFNVLHSHYEVLDHLISGLNLVRSQKKEEE